MAEVQPGQHLAHRPLVQLHTKFTGDLVTQVDQPPAHHLMALWIRPLPHPHRQLLLGREHPGTARRLPPALTFQHQSQSQRAPGNRTVSATRRCLSKLRSAAERSSRIIATAMFKPPRLNRS